MKFKLADFYGSSRGEEGVLLAPYTTFKIGGPADFFYEVQGSRDLAKAVRLAREVGISYFVLGSGSNILVSDEGFRGLVIRNWSRNRNLKIESGNSGASRLTTKPRLEQLDEEKFYAFEGNSVQYDSGSAFVFVEADSGFKLEELATSLFDQRIVGLEYFAGIPGTVGGAVYGNSHGGTKFFGEYVVGAEVLTKKGEVIKVNQDFFQFDYDYSSLKENEGIVLSVTLRLWYGDGKRAREVFDTWKERKIRQPKRSAGCIFQNLDELDQGKLGLPTNSVGYVLDQVLHLKGKKRGDAEISDYHAAFIVNRGKARASDVRYLVELCKKRARNELGLELKEEIGYVGFD